MPTSSRRPSPEPGPPLTAARALLAAETDAPDAALDWEAAATLAPDQRLGAWLYALGRRRAAPAAALGRLQPAWRAGRRQYLLGVRELGLLLDALAAADVPTIPLKGPALAETLYRDPAARPFTDLDLLVPETRADRAVAALQDLGYRHLGHERPLAFERLHAGAACFVPATPGALTLPVDLHWSLLTFPGTVVPRGLPDTGIWARAVTVERLGRAVRQLGDEDLLLYLALHLAVHHPLTGLRWRLDLGVLLATRAATLDWPALTARARTWGVAGGLYFALRAVERSLGAGPPPSVLDALRPRGLRGRLLDRLALDTRDRPQLEYLVSLLSLDAAADRRRMLRRALAPPSRWVRARYGSPSALRGWRAHYGHALGALVRR